MLYSVVILVLLSINFTNLSVLPNRTIDDKTTITHMFLTSHQHEVIFDEYSLLTHLSNIVANIQQEGPLYDECVTGKKLVTKCMIEFDTQSRKEALDLANMLQKKNIIVHAVRKRIEVVDSDEEIYKFVFTGSDIEREVMRGYLKRNSSAVNETEINEWVEQSAELLRQHTAQKDRITALLYQVENLRSLVDPKQRIEPPVEIPRSKIIPSEPSTLGNVIVKQIRKVRDKLAITVSSEISVEEVELQSTVVAREPSIHLTDLLQCETERALFKKFAESEYSSESIVFWEYVQRWKHAKSKLKKSQLRKKIYKKFITSDAKYEVNLSSYLRDEIQRLYAQRRKSTSSNNDCSDKSSPTESHLTSFEEAFDLAEREIEKCMIDIWNRFKESDIWIDYCSTF